MIDHEAATAAQFESRAPIWQVGRSESQSRTIDGAVDEMLQQEFLRGDTRDAHAVVMPSLISCRANCPDTLTVFTGIVDVDLRATGRIAVDQDIAASNFSAVVEVVCGNQKSNPFCRRA